MTNYSAVVMGIYQLVQATMDIRVNMLIFAPFAERCNDELPQISSVSVQPLLEHHFRFDHYQV